MAEGIRITIPALVIDRLFALIESDAQVGHGDENDEAISQWVEFERRLDVAVTQWRKQLPAARDRK